LSSTRLADASHGLTAQPVVVFCIRYSEVTVERLQLTPDLAEQTYEAILAAICDGKLPAGTRIRQEALAATLDVSRQPVTQALLLLKKQGFLRETGRRGLVVAPLDQHDIRHLYEIRAALDGLAARGAAVRHPEEAGRRGAALIALGRKAVAKGSVAALLAADMEFHRLLYDLSGNPLIADTAALHWQRVRRVMGQHLQDPASLEGVWDDHAAILAAVAAGDAEQAESLSRAHAEGSARLLIARMEPTQSEQRQAS
jgi:DNA-binding GntR family transcriptional regulator